MVDIFRSGIAESFRLGINTGILGFLSVWAVYIVVQFVVLFYTIRYLLNAYLQAGLANGIYVCTYKVWMCGCMKFMNLWISVIICRKEENIPYAIAISQIGL
jgi:hypothetical protein